MLIIFRVVFHFLCSIGRFFRKTFQVIFGRRHDEYASSVSKTEPVTLEHIRIIGEMENDSHRPLHSFTSSPKIPPAEWNTWGADDIFRQKQTANNSSTSATNDDQVDYFTDIAATVKKTPKIILKKRVNENDNFANTNNQRSTRLEMTNDELADFRPDLSEWQEGDGNPAGTSNSVWNDNDDFNELSHEANEALRGKKTNMRLI